MSRKLTVLSTAAAAICLVWLIGPFTTAQGPPVAAVQDVQESEGVEVLTRGPVHEAFAEPVTLERADPLMIPSAPPEPVEELPPEQRPEGENVQWIGGYWAWDDEREDFLWVSGVWRDVPPGQRWVPGYWSEGARGWYWTSGFWISEQVAEVEYLPEPPESLEAGPPVAAPSEDHAWVPGVWRHRETRYVWQPGYWTIVEPDWVWVPARYVWCPTGYIFVDGYWDYPLVRRGVLFAPVYYREPVFQHVQYYYTPTVVIHPEILTVHLFARPRYCHYYFGDFYAPRYRDFGIVPWFTLHARGYDPLFSYYRWHHRRRDPDWHRSVRRRYEFFARNEEYRPAHTFAEFRRQRRRDVRVGDPTIQNFVSQQSNLAVTLTQYVENSERGPRGEGRRGLRFARVPDEQRADFRERARQIRSVVERRAEVETAPPEPTGIARRERQERPRLRLEDVATVREPPDAARRTTRDGRARPDRVESTEQPESPLRRGQGPISRTDELERRAERDTVEGDVERQRLGDPRRTVDRERRLARPDLVEEGPTTDPRVVVEELPTTEQPAQPVGPESPLRRARPRISGTPGLERRTGRDAVGVQPREQPSDLGRRSDAERELRRRDLGELRSATTPSVDNDVVDRWRQAREEALRNRARPIDDSLRPQAGERNLRERAQPDIRRQFPEESEQRQRPSAATRTLPQVDRTDPFRARARSIVPEQPVERSRLNEQMLQERRTLSPRAEEADIRSRFRQDQGALDQRRSGYAPRQDVPRLPDASSVPGGFDRRARRSDDGGRNFRQDSRGLPQGLQQPPGSARTPEMLRDPRSQRQGEIRALDRSDLRRGALERRGFDGTADAPQRFSRGMDIRSAVPQEPRSLRAGGGPELRQERGRPDDRRGRGRRGDTDDD